MAQSKQQIQSILAQAGGEPLHRFGQNFMIDQNLVRLVADAGELTAGETVIEVGPGTGTLTEELLARGPDVVAVEIDRGLAEALRQRLGSEPRFKLIEGDALAGKHGLNTELLDAIKQAQAANRKVKLVANLPYNIASPLLIELLLGGADLLAFTVQKEVALRLRSTAADDEYGPITVMVQMLGRVEILRTLPPQAFWPQPKIDSALVRVIRNDRLGARARDFSRFIQKLFSFRRKTLRKGLLQAGYQAEQLLTSAGINGQARVETLSPETLLTLFTLSSQIGFDGAKPSG
jgi:16S rRNA (adenine1518-N6/adenine1519-N6)-dimethyltransferase